MKKHLLGMALVAASLLGMQAGTASAMSQSPAGETYDVVILNGRVMDPETKFDGVRNVGIKDGIIKTITRSEINGKEVIDATGLVVAPGFIDTHIHSITPLGRDIMLRDGVTTAIASEFGVLDVDKFYDERKGKWRANYGAMVGLNYARMKVMDGITAQDDIDWLTATKKAVKTGSRWSTKIPSPEEEKQIMAIMKKGLDRGALGVGIAVGYASTGTTAREVYEVQNLAAQYGRVTASHTRFGSGLPPDEFILGGDEIIANAMYLKAPAIFQHFHNGDWQLGAEILKRVQAQGYNIWGEIYPYAAYSTQAGSDFVAPENFKRNHLDISKSVLDPSTGKYLTEAELIKMRKEEPNHLVVVFSRNKDDIPKWLAIEGATIASDGMPALDAKGNILPEDAPLEKVATHPRLAGTNARALRYAREYHIPLMTVLANMTYWPAKRLGDTGLKDMQVRGRMQEGMVADITLFNPKTVRDNADYGPGKNALPPDGIPYVLVNGVITVKDGKIVKSAHAGQPIRFPVKE